jgi:hypothetical protein
MTFHQGRPRDQMAPCLPANRSEQCFTCLRYRPGGYIKGQPIDASALTWMDGKCPMKEPTEPQSARTASAALRPNVLIGRT